MAKFKVKQKFISGLPKLSYRLGKPEGVVLHETGAWGGTAKGNRNYEKSTWNTAFVHFFVDWKTILQVAPTEYLAYGAGHVANQRFVHVELVRTKNKMKFRASYDRYVWQVAKLLHEYNLKPERKKTLWTHHDVTNVLGGTTHTDPDSYLAYHGYSVEKLIADIEDAYRDDKSPSHHIDHKTQTEATHTTSSSSPSSSKWTKVGGSWHGQTLKRGEYGKPVRQLQTKLVKHHPPFYPNKGAKNNGIDGYYGADTEDAVKRFQTVTSGLKVDGIAGKATYKALTGKASKKKANKPKKSSKLPTGVIREGAKGTKVRRVQKALASVYFYPDKSAKNHGVDGVYGANTADAVKRFQSMHRLKPDGVYGPKTRKALVKAAK